MKKNHFIISKGLKRILNPPAIRNCTLDMTAKVCSKSELTKVSIGKYSYVGNDCFMVNVDIGAFCSIADRVCIGGANHPIERVSSSPVFHEGKNVLGKNFQKFPFEHTPKTIIGNDVWLGIGVIVKAGVHIHTGAVVGMGSVVTRDIPAYEIWAGNPAKKIRDRFDQATAEKLLETKWWDSSDNDIEEFSKYFESAALFLDEIHDEN